MNLENRLRNHLHDQSDALSVDTPGSAAVAARARARRRRQQTTTFAVFAVVLLGIGGWLVGALGGDESSTLEVAEGVDAAEATTTTIDDTVEAESDDADAASSSSLATSDAEVDVDEIVRPEPGTPLTFTAVEDELAPGGWNVFQNGHSGGLYYVLSTAPGATGQDTGDEFARNDTLYTWTDGEWTTGSFADRFVSNVSASNDLLYSVSTGTRSGATGLEVGTSSDGGATWAWTPIDLSDQFGDDPATWPAYDAKTVSTPDGQLVVVSRSPGADWEQALLLAQDAGLDISWETHSIHQVDANGISYGDSYDALRSPCARAFDDAMIESGAYEWGEGLLDYPTEDSTPAEIEAYTAELEAGRARWVATAEAILADLATKPECDAYVECQQVSLAWDEKVTAETGALFAELDIDPYSNYWEQLSADERATLEKRQNEIYGDGPFGAGNTECDKELYGVVESDPEITTVTWQSLGVTPPAEWSGSIAAYLADDTGTRPIDVPFRPGFVDSIDATADGLVVRITEIGSGVEAPATTTTWTGSPDGEWTEQQSAGGVGTSTFAGASFGLDWQAAVKKDADTSGPLLVRHDSDGTVGMRLEDLAPELDTEGFQLNSVQTGGYGVVAVAVEWDAVDPESDEPGIFRNSIVLYSSDGITWGATELPGIEVTAMIVGDDGVMAFITSPDLVGTTTPRPVLLGS